MSLSNLYKSSLGVLIFRFLAIHTFTLAASWILEIEVHFCVCHTVFADQLMEGVGIINVEQQQKPLACVVCLSLGLYLGHDLVFVPYNDDIRSSFAALASQVLFFSFSFVSKMWPEIPSCFSLSLSLSLLFSSKFYFPSSSSIFEIPKYVVTALSYFFFLLVWCSYSSPIHILPRFVFILFHPHSTCMSCFASQISLIWCQSPNLLLFILTKTLKMR